MLKKNFMNHGNAQKGESKRLITKLLERTNTLTLNFLNFFYYRSFIKKYPVSTDIL